MKKLTIAMLILTAVSSCGKKEVPTDNSGELFKLQGQVFECANGDGTIDYIGFGVYATKSSKVGDPAPSKFPLTIANCKIGGQQSFSNNSGSTDFSYINTITADTAQVIQDRLVLPTGDITYHISGEKSSNGNINYSTRVIDQVYYKGKTFLPSRIKSGLGTEHGQVALNASFVTTDKECRQTSCYNGITATIKWQLSASGIITINFPDKTITGQLIRNDYATPRFYDAVGNEYVICFYSNVVGCQCDMSLKLYRISQSQSAGKNSIGIGAELVVGDC